MSGRENVLLTGGNLEQDPAYRVVARADKRYHERCCGRPVDTLTQTVDKCHKWGGWWCMDGWMAGARESLTRVSKIRTAPLGDPQIIQPVSSCSDLPWAISQEESKFWPGGAKTNSGRAPNYSNIFWGPQITHTIWWWPTFWREPTFWRSHVYRGDNTFSTFSCILKSLQKENKEKVGIRPF